MSPRVPRHTLLVRCHMYSMCGHLTWLVTCDVGHTIGLLLLQLSQLCWAQTDRRETVYKPKMPRVLSNNNNKCHHQVRLILSLNWGNEFKKTKTTTRESRERFKFYFKVKSACVYNKKSLKLTTTLIISFIVVEFSGVRRRRRHQSIN